MTLRERRYSLLRAIGRPARVALALAALLALFGGLALLWIRMPLVGSLAICLSVGVGWVVRPSVGRFFKPRAQRNAQWLLVQEYAVLARKRGRRAIVSTLERTRSRSAREILAFLASDGRLDLSEIVATLVTYRDPALRRGAGKALKILHLGWGVELARIIQLQAESPLDSWESATLYRFFIDRDGMGSLPYAHQRHYVEALLSVGDRSAASPIVAGWSKPSAEDLGFAADVINPFVDADAPDDGESRWLAVVNAAYAEAGVELLRLIDTGETPFDRLAAEPPASIAEGPLVTVVISTFRPGAELFSSLASVISQSWATLEILVVDDGSGASFDELFGNVQSMDSRIRVLRISDNGGTYRARNVALDSARGELITFHDDDDWMHPRRVECQVAHLLDDPDSLANASLSVRVTDRLEFSHSRGAGPKICEPSLMFRRELVVGKIGYFDTVRKNGDVEFRRRLQAAFDGPVPVVGEVPLTWQRTSGGSLSDSDIRHRWVSGPRLVHARSAELWHRAISAGIEDPYVSVTNSERRIYAPKVLLEARSDPETFDVLFVSNWSVMGSQGGSQRSNEEEIRALAATGMKVAIAHVEALWFMNADRWRVSPRAIQLLEDGLADFVDLRDDVRAKLVVVRYPPILQFLDPARNGVRADRVLIVANQPPHDDDGSGRRFDVDECARRVYAAFGKWPVWVPQGPLVRELFASLVPSAYLLGSDMPPLIDPSDWRVDRLAPEGRRPVVGRYSRDVATKWPASKSDLLRIYDSHHFDTRIMGGPDTVRSVLGKARWPRDWVVVRAGEVPVRDFLAGIDFFVYFHHPSYREAYGRSIVEAMASGAIVVLPRSFEPVFGDAAVYAYPATVESTVLGLWKDRAEFQSQVDRGKRFAAETAGHAGYRALISSLVTS